jgi:isocitrate lyase
VAGEDLPHARQVRCTPRQGRVVVVGEDLVEDVVAARTAYAVQSSFQ